MLAGRLAHTLHLHELLDDMFELLELLICGAPWLKRRCFLCVDSAPSMYARMNQSVLVRHKLSCLASGQEECWDDVINKQLHVYQ